LKVTVCYAGVNELWHTELVLGPLDSTAQQALALSGFSAAFPELDISVSGFGVFGSKVSGDYILTDGDRLEIYRPLTVDPKQSRRRRVAHRDKVRHTKKKVPINDQTAV
jgi:hypothetical protein